VRHAGRRATDEPSAGAPGVIEAVLDASALLALLNAEPGSEAVATALPDAAISAVNLAEVVAKLTDHGLPDAAVREVVARLGLIVMPFEAADAFAAGLLQPHTRRLGLSLGDRACLALAMALDVAAYTADRSWAELDVQVEVVVIR